MFAHSAQALKAVAGRDAAYNYGTSYNELGRLSHDVLFRLLVVIPSFSVLWCRTTANCCTASDALMVPISL